MFKMKIPILGIYNLSTTSRLYNNFPSHWEERIFFGKRPWMTYYYKMKPIHEKSYKHNTNFLQEALKKKLGTSAKSSLCNDPECSFCMGM